MESQVLHAGVKYCLKKYPLIYATFCLQISTNVKFPNLVEMEELVKTSLAVTNAPVRPVILEKTVKQVRVSSF